MQLANINTPNLTVSASTSSGGGQLGGAFGRGNIIVFNSTNATAYVISGKTSTPTADSTCFPVGAGVTQTLKKQSDHDYFAVILESGSGKVYFIATDGE